MTRYPKRYIITLNNNFDIISSVYLCDTSELGGVTGDITTDGNYFYIPTWRSDIDSLYNQINVYSKNGEIVKEYTIKEISHIESIDIINKTFYSSFIDFSDSSNPAKVYEWENVVN